MKKVKFYTMNFSNINSKVEEIFIYDDETTEEEIQADFEDWLNNYTDIGWYIIDEE